MLPGTPPLDWSRGLFQGSLGGKENHEGSPKHQHEFCQCAMKASQRKMPGCSRGAKGRRSFQSLQFHAGPPLGLAGGVLPLVQGMMDNATISSCGRAAAGIDRTGGQGKGFARPPMQIQRKYCIASANSAQASLQSLLSHLSSSRECTGYLPPSVDCT